MAKFLRRKRTRHHIHRRTAPGASPGTVTIDPAAVRSEVQLIAYGPERLEERTIQRIDAIDKYLNHWPITWVNVDGLGDADVIRKLGEMFGIHRLALEDVVNVHQRCKVEHYEDHLFIVARMPQRPGRFETEQISLFLGKQFVLTFQERPGDCLAPVRGRIRQPRSRMRQAGPDYLAYACLDAIIDSYFPVMEQLAEQLDQLEDEVLRGAARDVIPRLHMAKGELLFARRAIWQKRDLMNELLRDTNGVIGPETVIYLRDCYDHTLQIMELIENYRELSSDLLQIDLALVNNRMNDIMRVLTVAATIFMPLTFIAGVYGMNFDPDVSRWNMPELQWPYGYPATLGVMAAVAAAMVYFFRRKGWLGPIEPTGEAAEPPVEREPPSA